ncbi:uncharacterized protein LOC103515307 [Diaphorina citri]|uniref:Uncharacterized protein LOC103515307 n=1 Tax=Diaphorina citri TaxID=121845 RepID=A0A1S3DCY9_DIACI|nr:uncharacterized protein LOC103515307 [Diaphorina citri]XP_008478468.1 uncharacterized protein LOC103515307 [Diaphorina citri]XP_008478469.1 uncharacterized protein LOC103515307 [Diaphorina citri]XP_008478470.1 uncharacterized protein LOC103515307 [Diaphorina citri]
MGGGGPKGYRSDTGGIIPMNLQGRMAFERERLFGMTDQERSWRAKFVKDQKLAPHEPVEVPEIYTELVNPIRRFYRAPGDKFQAWLKPRVGTQWAEHIRYGIGKGSLMLLSVYAAYYYYKYNRNTWEKHGAIKVYTNKPLVLPGDKNYPQPNLDHPPSFYVDKQRGFTDAVPDY